MTPLLECVEDIREFAKTYNGRGKFRKMANMRGDNGKIEELKGRVETLVPIMNLASVVTVAEQVADVARELASLKKVIIASYAGTLVSTCTLDFCTTRSSYKRCLFCYKRLLSLVL